MISPNKPNEHQSPILSADPVYNHEEPAHLLPIRFLIYLHRMMGEWIINIEFVIDN